MNLISSMLRFRARSRAGTIPPFVTPNTVSKSLRISRTFLATFWISKSTFFQLNISFTVNGTGLNLRLIVILVNVRYILSMLHKISKPFNFLCKYNSTMEKNVEKAIVKIFHDGMPRIRTGRGFSRTELRQAGILNTSIAASKEIPLDNLRTTSHPENVEELIKILSYSKIDNNTNRDVAKTKLPKVKATTKENNKKTTNKKKSEKSKKSRSIAKIIRRKS